MNMPSLQAGVARRRITPPPGTRLFGYPGERQGNEVADDLNATTLVLQTDTCTAVLVSLDWAMIDEAEVHAIREETTARTGIPPYNITFCATHTHSGPETTGAWGWSVRNTEYLQNVRPLIVDAIAEAQKSVQPVRVGIAATESDVGINRREVTVEGDVILGFNEWGPRDKELTVVRLEGETGPLATLVHLGAHPTSRGGEPSISRDWPGVMMDRVEAVTGAPVVFINGAFGDVAPRTNIGGVTGDGAPAATEVGLRAATDVLRAWKSLKLFQDLQLETFTEEIHLPHAPLGSLEEARQQLEERDGQQDEPGANGCEWGYWNAVLQAHGEPLQSSRPFLQTITRLGPLVIVPFGGEIFSEIALRLRQASPFAYTLCAGTSNAAHGYYVTRDSRARGGYEPWVARAMGAYILADNIDDVLVQENLRLVQQLVQ